MAWRRGPSSARGRIPARSPRSSTGEGERSRRDNITSRILWLEGLEPGLNRGGNIDSHQRYIYIHGTDEEGRIGQPASEGCVRMRNAEVIELFPRLPTGTLVVILSGPDYETGRILPV